MATQLQPLGQSFPLFLLQLYRNWYGLPRKSTQAWLQARRFELSVSLTQDQPIDAVRSFVEASSRRPGLAETAAAELASVRRSMDTGFLSVLEPQTIDQFIKLLTVDDPIGFAFGQWVYLSSRATETVANVQKRLSPDLMIRLPMPTRSEIETIFSRLDTHREETGPSEAPPFSSLAASQRQVELNALSELETNSTVLRIAWRELLAGKAANEPKTLGFGSSILESTEAVAMANNVNENAPTTPHSTRFHTDVNFPSQVKPGIETPLTVRLTLEASEDAQFDELLDIQFADPAKAELIDVVLDAPGFSERFNLWNRTMLVYADQDSEPVTFLLAADKQDHLTQGDPQKRRIKVNFYHGGKHIGQGAFDVTITTHTRPSAPNVRPVDDVADVELRLVDLPQPADLELRVTHDPASQELHFMLHSTKSTVGYHWRRMGKVPLLDGKPQLFFERQLEQLNEWSGLLPDDLYVDEADEFTRKMANMGESLFEMLFSPELKDVFWRDILPKMESGLIRNLLITSDEPWIPWELVKPYRYDEVSDQEYEGDYLASSFEICRWLTGHGPYERVTVDSAGIVAPDVDLAHVKSETEHLEQLSDYGVTLQAGLQTKAQVLDLVQAGNTRLLHVASHAQFDADHPDASPLMLYDADLLPEDLDRRVIRRWRKARPPSATRS